MRDTVILLGDRQAAHSVVAIESVFCFLAFGVLPELTLRLPVELLGVSAELELIGVLLLDKIGIFAELVLRFLLVLEDFSAAEEIGWLLSALRSGLLLLLEDRGVGVGVAALVGMLLLGLAVLSSVSAEFVLGCWSLVLIVEVLDVSARELAVRFWRLVLASFGASVALTLRLWLLLLEEFGVSEELDLRFWLVVVEEFGVLATRVLLRIWPLLEALSLSAELL